MSDKYSDDVSGYASEQAPYPKALVDARAASGRFRGRWRRPIEHASAFLNEETLGDDPSIWRRTAEPARPEPRPALPSPASRDAATESFLARAARAAFRRLLGP